MRAAFYTLGCKVNQYESQAMEELFRRRGYEIVPPSQEAELYIVNSCTVTSSGDKKTRQIVRRLRREHPLAVVALTGCLPQTDPRAAEELPEADLVLGTRERRTVVEAVEEYLARRQRLVRVLPHEAEEPFEPLEALGDDGHTRAFLKIQDGCTQFCAYCIIPFARGPLRSRELAALREEIAGLAAAGYREVVLTGINLSLYGRELGLRLPDAVEATASVPGIDRVRIGSLEPELLTDEDIARLAAVPQLCGQFHLSLQSGCDATLARMNRHYTAARYREIAGALREKFPGCAITTDVITGFPGETPEEFAETCRFVREMGFAMVHIFPYSVRPGTPAAGMTRHSGGVDARCGSHGGAPAPGGGAGGDHCQQCPGFLPGPGGDGPDAARREKTGAGLGPGLHSQLHPGAGPLYGRPPGRAPSGPDHRGRPGGLHRHLCRLTKPFFPDRTGNDDREQEKQCKTKTPLSGGRGLRSCAICLFTGSMWRRKNPSPWKLPGFWHLSGTISAFQSSAMSGCSTGMM